MFKFTKNSKHYGLPIDRVLVSKDLQKVVAIVGRKKLNISAKEVVLSAYNYTINQDDIKENELIKFLSETGIIPDANDNFEAKVSASYYKYNRQSGDDPEELEDFVVEYTNKINNYVIPVEDFLTKNSLDGLYEKTLREVKQERSGKFDSSGY